VFESTAAIYNGKVVGTGAKDLPLTHVYMNSNFDDNYFRQMCAYF
jgi:hypothetical protein